MADRSLPTVNMEAPVIDHRRKAAMDTVLSGMCGVTLAVTAAMKNVADTTATIVTTTMAALVRTQIDWVERRDSPCRVGLKSLLHWANRSTTP